MTYLLPWISAAILCCFDGPLLKASSTRRVTFWESLRNLSHFYYTFFILPSTILEELQTLINLTTAEV